MKRQLPGLSETVTEDAADLAGRHLPGSPGECAIPLARAEALLRASILCARAEARLPVRRSIGRLYCTAKAMWKLGWFLRDFLYDPELLSTRRDR